MYFCQMQLGKINKLKLGRTTRFASYLVDDKNNEVQLPDDFKEQLNLNDELEVFIYLNSEDQYVATTTKPLIELNRFAYLQVKDINKVGAFMDIGIPKDLLVPFAEQTEQMYVGNWYLVFMFLDEETDRLVGSCKENDFVFKDKIDIERGNTVDLLLYRKTENGMNAIVNNLYKGLVFNSDIHKNIKEGTTVKGYVKNVREDGKIDLVLEPIGYKESIDNATSLILDKLKKNDGVLHITDKSSPEIIKKEFGLSKKAFKRSLGSLYKKNIIEILEDCVKLI
ncbi:MAG: S1-like domain-containing RNA-binding protein [Flavobacteriaceae bacterium]|nr:S1-like domain-containing RNA-binding protein [Flavobacteriaceae bacterium]